MKKAELLKQRDTFIDLVERVTMAEYDLRAAEKDLEYAKKCLADFTKELK